MSQKFTLLLRLLRNEYNLHIPVAILFAVRSDKESLVEKLFVKNLTESWIFFQMFFFSNKDTEERMEI